MGNPKSLPTSSMSVCTYLRGDFNKITTAKHHQTYHWRQLLDNRETWVIQLTVVAKALWTFHLKLASHPSAKMSWVRKSQWKICTAVIHFLAWDTLPGESQLWIKMFSITIQMFSHHTHFIFHNLPFRTKFHCICHCCWLYENSGTILSEK